MDLQGPRETEAFVFFKRIAKPKLPDPETPHILTKIFMLSP